MFQTKRQISSGGIIFKKEKNRIKVVLISRKDNTIWCLPKGKVEKRETPKETAKRETKEETGIEGEVVKKINFIHYFYTVKETNTRFSKTVYFYLLRYKGGSVKDHDKEVDRAEWVDIDEAIKRLTYSSEKETMKKAKLMLETLEN